MVVLTAAAIGAASYGVYKGGEASVNKGKECHRELQREKKRATQRSSLHEKAKSRTSRIAEIIQMKEHGSSSSSSSSSGAGMFGFGTKGEATSTATTTTTTASTPRASFAERQIVEKEATSDVNNRHRAVMEKLKSGRKVEKKKRSSFNPFKKK